MVGASREEDRTEVVFFGIPDCIQFRRDLISMDDYLRF